MVKNILVVEDDFATATLLHMLLEYQGRFKVYTANDGDDALAKLGVEPDNEEAALPDLIVMDIMMPKLDGYSVIQRLAAHPRTRDVPIIVVTAKPKMREMILGSKNVAGYVDKPFKELELRQMVARVLLAKAPPSSSPEVE